MVWRRIHWHTVAGLHLNSHDVTSSVPLAYSRNTINNMGDNFNTVSYNYATPHIICGTSSLRQPLLSKIQTVCVYNLCYLRVICTSAP